MAGPDDRYPGATDDEIVGVICAWARAEAHAAARKLAAVAELIRRRPAEDCVPQVPAEGTAAEGSAPQVPAKGVAPEGTAPQVPAKGAAPEGTAPQVPAEGAAGEGSAPHGLAEGAAPEGSAPQVPAKGAAPEGAAGRSAAKGPGTTRPWIPEAWDEFAVDELSCALGESRAAAEDLLDLAHSLAARLPGTMAALRDGVLSQAKADIIAQATSALDPGESAAAEDLVLGRAARLTRPGLRAAIARAVMEVAPEEGEEAPGGGGEENPGGAVDGGLGERGPGRPGTAPGAGPGGRPAGHRVGEGAAGGGPGRRHGRAARDGVPGHPAGHGLPARRPVTRRLAGAASPSADPPDAGPPPANPWDYRPPGGPFPAGFAARLNLTVPLATALGLADRPGEAGGLGPIDPWLARDLARAAARNPKTTWCVTVTDADGHAIGHGCARPAPKDPRKPPAKRRKPGPPGSPGPPGGHDPPGSGPDRQRFSFTATGGHGPPGGYGTWRLSAGIPGQRDLVIAIGPVATDECDHRHQARGHDPGVLLRHLTEVRHATCTAPTCRRPATTCDFEHNIPYESGGRTCECNGGPKCRHHHRLKQDPKWKVEQPTPAALHWRTPAGRLYTTEPTRYPI